MMGYADSGGCRGAVIPSVNLTSECARTPEGRNSQSRVFWTIFKTSVLVCATRHLCGSLKAQTYTASTLRLLLRSLFVGMCPGTAAATTQRLTYYTVYYAVGLPVELRFAMSTISHRVSSHLELAANSTVGQPVRF